ncbi:hypothetical protein R3P38DRAFT_3319734 [Favolaschia claudopus]|uniref:F-box domain-containing protein n=1 Tax=Favolaschia claudopus TaxID=2862362 RepID=A0AAW0AZL6_9AGAR
MQSPFASRLHTNYCASDDEISELKGLLAEPRLRLAKLDGEILALRQKLDGLVEQRESLCAHIQSHQALMSPIRRIPLDVLEQIFLACLPTHRNCVMSAQEAPVLLGRICSSWRTLSLSAPRLWSRLHIVLPPPDHESLSRDRDIFAAKTAQRLEVASTWLGRTGICPLSISVEREFHLNHLDLPEDLLELLIPYASRWQHLSLVLPPSGFERLSRLSENDVPLLMSLSMSSAPIMDPAYTWTPAGIVFAPNLSSFEFAGSGIIPSALPLRWNTLTELSLRVSSWNWNSGLTCETALDILARCHALRSCKLLIQEISESQVLPTNPIVPCSFLRAFELQCYKTPLRTAEYLLNHFSHLALEEFSLSAALGDREDPDNIQGITSALGRCPQLRSIVIQTDIFSKSSFMDFSRCLPSTVQRLKMVAMCGWGEGSLDNNNVLQAFEASADRPAACPALREFIVEGYLLISDDALLRFIVSRMPTLRRVHARLSREKQVDILPNLLPFIAAGLEVSLQYYDPPEPLRPNFSPWEGLRDYR